MNIIEQVLAQVPRPEGLVAAHVVERVTGQVLATLEGPAAPEGTGGAEPVRDLASAIARCLLVLEDAAAPHGGDEDVEDLVVTWSHHHHLARVVPDVGGGEVLVLLTLDRAQSNLALARHLLLRMEVQLVP